MNGNGPGSESPPGHDPLGITAPLTSGTGATVTGLLAESDLTAGTVLAGRFRIERRLGIGGMGVVYLAYDQSLGVEVAIKLLRGELASRPDAYERFRQEILLARQVSSPHVVRIHDLALHEGRCLVSMDFVDGESLDRLLVRRGALPLDEALKIARQLALGLAAAHARGVVHRDLKPSNVLVDGQGNAIIGDFGIARSLGTSGLTQTGVVLGTPRYMSPEQAKAEPVDARSDLYALGLLLHEMLSGEVAFGAGTAAESLSQRLVGPPRPLSRDKVAVPAWVQRLLDRLLQPQPSHRLRSAEAVVAAIDRREVARDWRPGRRTGWVVAALLAGVVVAWAFWQRPGPSAMAALPPVDRVVVLPIEHAAGNPALDDALAGYVEHLRQGLDGLPDVQVVDGERTAQAVAQLGLPDAGVPDARRVLAEIPARTVLRTHLGRAGAAYVFTGTLVGDGMPDRTIAAPSAPDLPGAGLRYAQAVADALQPGAGATATVLPADEAAMTEYGGGMRLRREGRLDLAIARFAKASSLDPRYAAAWLALAEASVRAGHEDAADSALKQGLALPAAPAVHEALVEWRALLDGDTTQAVATLAKQVAAHPGDLDAQQRIGWLQGEGGDPAAALKTLAAVAARDPNDPRVAYLQGKYSILHGDLRPAVDDYLVRALVLYKRARNAFGEAETVNALGNGFARLGQTADAEEQYRKAVELRRALGDRRGVASSLRNLARMNMIQGRFDDSQAELGEARGQFESLGDPQGVAAVDNEIGLLAEERGRYPDALEAFRLALHEREALDDRQGVAETLNNIGFAHYQLGDYDNAQVFWKQALDAFTKVEDGNGVVRAQQNLGLLETARGHWDASRKLLLASLASAQAQQMAEESSVSERNLGELELDQGHFAAAMERLQHAEAAFKAREDERGLADVGLLEAQLALAANDPEGAVRRLDALAETLAKSSDEQRASATLLRAHIEGRRGHADAAKAALAEAEPLATRSGVKVLQLQLGMLRGNGSDPAVAGAIHSLGNVPLELASLRRAMAADLRAGHFDAVADGYRRSRALLGGGDAADAFALHAFAAAALEKAGDAAAAAAAQRDALSALGALRAAANPGQRRSIDADPVMATLAPDATSSRPDSGKGADHAR